MSDENSSENKDTGERRIIPQVVPVDLFRQAWEELCQESTEDLTARTVELVTREGETKKLSCLEFWLQMFKEVEEQKKLPDYLFTPIAEQKIWETFSVVLECPTEDESSIFMRGLYYTPRPSNKYLQNLNLGYDQWFIVQDYPPKRKVIKILRCRPDSPSASDENIIQRLIEAMEWACPSGSSTSTNISLPAIEPKEDRILEDTTRSLTQGILNVSLEPVEDEMNLPNNSQKTKISREISISNEDSLVSHDSLLSTHITRAESSQSQSESGAESSQFQSKPSTESSQSQFVPLTESQNANQDQRKQRNPEQEYQLYRERRRRLRLQRAFRQPPALLERLPITPAPAHLTSRTLNPTEPFPAHLAVPHYDSAWNYSNSFVPYQIVPWNSDQLPLLPQTPVPQMYTQMPYVQVPGPYWVPNEGAQLPQTVDPPAMAPNPWVPQEEPAPINTNLGQQLYYPAENYYVAHQPSYSSSILPEYYQPIYPFLINNNMAHESNNVNTQNLQSNEDTVPYIILRPEELAARQLEMNCRIIESQSAYQEAAPDSQNTMLRSEMTRTQMLDQNTTIQSEERRGPFTILKRKVTESDVQKRDIKNPENQSTQNNVQSEENVNTQTTQLLKDSGVFKVPLPPSKRTTKKTTESYKMDKQQTGQKRKKWQSNTDTENKYPVDEREYLQTPSIFEILESSKRADPREAEKAPTTYMEDVIQRKERRWKSMDKVPGSPRLDIILEMIRKDNEMLEEEERLQKEKEKSLAAASYSRKKIKTKDEDENLSEVKSKIFQDGPTQTVGNTDNEMLEEEKRLQREKEKSQVAASYSRKKIKTIDEDENLSEVKSKTFQYVPIQTVGKTEEKRLNNAEEETPKNLYSVQYSNTEEESMGVELPIIYLPPIVENELFKQVQNDAVHFICQPEDPIQSDDIIPMLSSSDVILHQIPVAQQSETSSDTVTPIRTADEMKVEIDDDEMALLENLKTSTDIFSPEVWVSDSFVLQLQNEPGITQKKPQLATIPTFVTSEENPKVEQEESDVQKLPKRQSPSPPRKEAQSDIKKEKSTLETGTEESESEQPVKYCARDQATQTSDGEFEDITEVAVETKDQSTQAKEEPKMLTYAAVVRKNK